jgi:hypothetical protein
MIWLAWRQFRAQTAVALGVLAAIAIVLAVTGPHLVHLYDTTVTPCASHGDCATATDLFMHHDRLLQQLRPAVLVAPALIGIFWGAPLVARELENNTFRLAWTQSVSRTRWLLTKIGLVGLASMATAGLLSLMVTWWSSPFDRLADHQFSPSYFDRSDLVPIGYAAFAFALGVTAGVLIRRTLPAMAATLVAFIGVRFAFLEWVRPHLMTPRMITTALPAPFASGPLPAAGLDRADWVISEQTINKAGQVIGQNGGFGPHGNFGFNASTAGRLTLSDGQACPSSIRIHNPGGLRAGPPSRSVTNAIQECLDKLHIRQVVSYQPVSRYWAFQWYETAIYVGLALLLAGFCVWWVRRRLS